MALVLTRGLHGCGGYGDSAGPAGNPRGRLRSVRGIRGIGFLTAQGHRGAGARREVTLHAAQTASSPLPPQSTPLGTVQIGPMQWHHHWYANNAIL